MSLVILKRFFCVIVFFLFVATFVIQRLQNTDPTLKKTQLEQQLKRLNLTIKCNGGRLGNQLFRYACLFGLALKNNRQGLVPHCLGEKVSHVFEISLPIDKDPSAWKKYEEYPVITNQNVSQYYNIPERAHIITGSVYKNSYVFVNHVEVEIRKELTFRKHLRDFAHNKLSALKGVRNNVTFVGVHVRRTDYPNYLKIVKKTEATMDYFKKAFNYYRQKFDTIVFVVVSDDLTWCREHFPWKDVYVIEGVRPPEYDLALLSSCNHSIIDYGTFGWWGAFLAGGETTYYVDAQERKLMDEGKARFFLPQWHGFS